MCRPGQEEGNIPFVENAGFGKYSNDPTVIAHMVSQWISSPEELKQMQQAAYAISSPNATLNIAKDIAEMLFQHLKVIS
jgi:1,2-diacylglycerol 3-beta-galactosyltransferase